MMILLDDAQSTSLKPSSRLYRQPLRSWSIYASCCDEENKNCIEQCLSEIQEALHQGQFLVAAFAYELGCYIHKLPCRITNNQNAPVHPIIAAWAFDSYESLSKEQVDIFLNHQLARSDQHPAISGVANLHQSLNEEQFSQDISTIHEYIRSGDCYQINHTYRITGDTYGEPLALYKRLRERQPGRFGAYIEDGENYILSQSPELFIQRNGDTLTAMPMKGTANALSDSATQLCNDSKNQAENVMIVDLLRNDLSRLALPGMVKVPHLFEVARHGDVLQMTSTVQAQAKPNIQLLDVLNAVFPCGSVTGAPKKRSMEIIQELEPTDRGYYCGALGWIDPSGDFALSVPIRTVEIQRDTQTQASRFTLGVGAGITIDSDARQEWEECHIKARFLSKLPSEVGLFETILISNGEPAQLKRHLNRLEHSAIALGIPLSRDYVSQAIKTACSKCDQSKQYRLRIDLETSGVVSCQLSPLTAIDEKVKVFLAKDILPNPKDAIMHSGNILLQHKVSSRDAYDEAWQKAQSLGGFDALFTNEQGYVTEGGRSSIFIKPTDDNTWLTPPVSAGVLPGVMRSIILSDAQWNAHEANLTIEDVKSAKAIMLTNALRGLIPAYL